MHITDVVALRPVPAAVVFMMLTRRCPLSCAHCSTNSMLASEQHNGEIFAEFARSFTAEDHPKIAYLTGGEPLLRPKLVREIATAAHAVGTQTVLISGFYFARPDGRIPPSLLRSMLAVDHVTVSLDEFHEAQVPRAAVFATIATLLGAGQDVSLQIVGTGAGDPYLEEVTTDLRNFFADRVPALVARLNPVGRAKMWLRKDVHRDAQPIVAPCSLAAWPLVGFDGTIVACCLQKVVDGPAPEHLLLGTAPATKWPAVARAMHERATLRVLRTYGPEVLADQAGIELSAKGYCATCALVGQPAGTAAAEALTRRPTFPIIEDEVLRMQLESGPTGFAARYGIPEYANMLNLGLDSQVPAAT
jgi:pyruvate-formate lyase-activating enzyme